jgi:hypothetical protein
MSDNRVDQEKRTEPTAVTIRARRGGEVAPNGAFYKGGQFINTVANNPKQSNISKESKTRKLEVAPYQYVLATHEERTACIYGKIADLCRFTEATFKSGDWKVDRSTVNHAHLEYIGMSFARFNQLADLFDGGARFEV